MANLIQIKHSDLSPTIDLLGKLGVTVEDFNDLRRYQDFACQVAALFTERRAKIEAALGDKEELALRAIEDFNDPRLLFDIAYKAMLVSVCKAALAKISIYDAYHVARTHPHLEVAKEALKYVSENGVWVLWCDLGVKNNQARRQLVAEEYKKRHGQWPY